MKSEHECICCYTIQLKTIELRSVSINILYSLYLLCLFDDLYIEVSAALISCTASICYVYLMICRSVSINILYSLYLLCLFDRSVSINILYSLYLLCLFDDLYIEVSALISCTASICYVYLMICI